ncbi:SNF2-related, N-terminal domain-containing protein [Artemisia annua]|uniref:SNF2-related, N-terminal domain-containing protein n=1 Tax=Artemisia annua TaxID=35608 RepID=A0A2U1Q6U2_ARTAN|nr:SNF2-related, N-terminal domain-containing protein [Artemisia annua]
MDFFKLPVGKRTRHQRQLYAQGLYGIDESQSCGSSKNQDWKRKRETNNKGSECAPRSTKRKLDEAIKVENLSSDESDSEEEESSEIGSGDNFTSSESDESSSDDDSSEDKSEEEGSNGAGRSTKRKLDDAIKVEKSSSDDSDSEEEESNKNGSGDNFRSSESESSEDKSDEEVESLLLYHCNRSDDPSRLNKVDKSSSSEVQEDECDEKVFDGANSRTCGSSSGYEQDDTEIIDVDDYWITRKGSGDNFRSSESESSEDKSDEEVESLLLYHCNRSDDPSRLNKVDKSSSSEVQEDECDEKVFDGANSRTCGSSSGYEQDDTEIIDVDDYWITRKGYKGSSSSTKRKLDEAKPVDKSLVDESEEELSKENDEFHSDNIVVTDDEEEEDEAVRDPSNDHHGNQNNSTTTEAELIDSSESDSDSSGWKNYFPPNKTPNHLSANKQSPSSNTKDLFSGSVKKKVAEQDEKEKVRSINRNDHSVNKEIDDLIDGIDTHENANAKGQVRGPYMTDNGVKYQRSKKGRPKDNGGSIDAILASIIGKEDVHEKEGGSCIPLKFRFDDSDDESASQITDESDVEALFQQIDLELQSEEIGSYGNSKVENQVKDGYEVHDNEATHFNCERGNHGDFYFEEQTGLRCRLCGAVLLESRYVIPKLANYAPARSRRGYHSNEQQFFPSENPYFQVSDGKLLKVCMQTKGTAWELIPKNIQGHLYPHQQEGFKFLWENLAGTVELQGLQNLGPCGGGIGGGCIISHAPGTGKTLLTIVFLESFLKKFPKCCPLIIVPSNMLDTWEAEFKKWQVGFSFINLNATDSLSKEMNINEFHSDNIVVTDDEEEEDEALRDPSNDHHGNQNNSTTTEAELIDSSESDSDSSGWKNYFPPNKTPNHLSANKQSPSSNTKDLFSGSVKKKVAEQDEKEKVRSINRNDHSVNKEIDDLIDGIDTHENANAKGQVRGPYMTDNGVKYQRSKKGRPKDNGGSIDAILASVIGKEDVHEKEGGSCIPLKFRFDDSDDESASQITDESDVEALFQQIDLELQSEEIGSYGNSKVENQVKDGYEVHDNEATHFNCERGNHGDFYFEEQTGLRCRLCGAVLLESRYVIPKLANYAPARSRRGYHSNEQQFFPSENPYFQVSDGKLLKVCMQTKGTAWELIPKNIQGHLYPHQQEGFKFLWENLAGTVELQGLQNLGPCGGGIGGGCIISHAPGTGKTLLTIVFLESFLKKFPKCCPLIIVPSNMLDTWEAEFKKWQVGFSFINLNATDSLSKEMNISSRNNTDLIRAMKIRCWCGGGSVLGVSYSLYEKIIGNTKTKNVNLGKMGNLLLDMPGLVILDEGHTPRNQRSNIWNILLKLKTKKRVILSGTPFQNNFQELFNTLRLVRPETVANIGNEKIFADMIQRKKKNKSRSMSTPEDIEKLKKIIAPFVNVHKGHILESKLPGLKQSIVLLNPPPLQKGLIEILDKSSTTFESEHKVALVSTHPYLILSCILTEKEKKGTNKRKLEKVRLHPDVGVKTRFVMEVIRLSVPLNEKVLIFSQYTAPLDLLKDQIAHVFGWDFGREIMLINGGTHQKLRQTIIKDFNDPNSKSKVLLASIKCCSEGIHLIGASRVVLLDIVWNPSVDTQAISRAYRLGQKKVVYTYHLMVAGTTEEEKYDTQVKKGRLAEMVFSSSAIEDPKSNVDKDVIELDDKILGKMVDHQDMKEIFKMIRYPENKARI